MLQYLRWGLNAVLFVSSCFLTARIANTVFDDALTPRSSVPLAAQSGHGEALKERSWADREIILTRNLFNSAALAPVPDPSTLAEELEATKLPLTLLGTAAATNELLSWAAIEDREKRDTLVVRVGDEIRPLATIMRIERRRVVLDENGMIRELTLDDESGPKSPRISKRPVRRAPPKRSAARGNRGRASRRPPAPKSMAVRQVDDDLFEVEREAVRSAMDNPSAFLDQARFMPKFESGEMVGLQINNPQPDSVFDQVGIQNGEVITEVNGIPIDSAEESRKVLSALESSDELDIVIRTPEGGERTLTIAIPGS
ncbi:PDZ domain-containing protein [Myxococcota bacterium]|nr:PDZ domain-containing protein [Myxococcota bacterium]